MPKWSSESEGIWPTTHGVYFNAEFSEKIWDLLLDQSDVKPAGLGARDTLRLEMGYPLYGHEMDIETTPIEAGFKGMLNLEDNRNFPGAEDLKNIPVKKQLAGIVLEGRRAAREGTEIMIDGQIVGKVSSGAFSPSLGKAIAMGYFNSEVQITPETQVELAVGRGTIPGKIASMPFYHDSTVRIKL